MSDAVIRCGNGCGAMLTFQRLREGQRTKSGVWCERCVSERVMTDCAKSIGLRGEEAQAFIAKGVTWCMRDSVQ